jgi:hypothetical protein
MIGTSCLTKAIRVALLLVFASGCGTAQARVPGLTSTDDSVVVAAAGDLVCGTLTPPEIPCLAARTAALLKQLQPNALLLLGDLQYETGSMADFMAFFDPVFGELKSITYPVPGNHEYFTRDAEGYFDYFNGVGADSGRAGSRRRGYYSFDLGAWHIVALNTVCEQIGGCARNSPQLRWLRDDLAAHPTKCTLAFAHLGRFSSGEHGNNELLRDLWQVLQAGGVDVFLAAHDHGYERFKPQDAAGRADEAGGIRSFVIGTGGKGTGRFMRTRPNSEIRNNDSIGVLLLTLRSEDYSWRFASVPGFALADSGSASCRG